MERFLKVKQAINLRELGGYATINGKYQLKWHKLLRSGAIKFAYGERSQLWYYGVRTVCDLRTPQEARYRPDKCGFLIHYHNVAVEPFAHSAVSSLGLPLARKLDWAHLSAVQQKYAQLLVDSNSLSAFKQMFMLLLENDHDHHAVLVHCTAGKERTSVAMFLILSALGIDPKVQRQDYLLSNLAYTTMTLAEKNHWARPENLAVGLTKCPEIPAVAGVNWDFLVKVATILGRGSILSYLEHYLGIDYHIRKKLAKIYLEPVGRK